MIKARLWICSIVLGTLMGMPALSHANLLLNPGFEAGFANWSATGVVGTGDALAVHSGAAGATLTVFGGNIEQTFFLSNEPFLHFSAWIRLYTPSLEGNTGLAQITMTLPGGSVVLGGPVDSFDPSRFMPVNIGNQQGWLSEWIFLQGSADLSGVPGGSSASIALSFLPGDGNGLNTTMFVDDVVVQHTPLPWAVSLFGSGLLGLLALRNRLRFR